MKIVYTDLSSIDNINSFFKKQQDYFLIYYLVYCSLAVAEHFSRQN